ncbi:MAG TPA: DUF1841 family protein [Gammaproteobacteria bacterium]|nr:DUF1841 family protein [Gammaproteobacteria bacterium]
MFYTQDRGKMREFMCEVWRKQCAAEAMDPMETMIGGVIAQHPEYHKLFENSEAATERDYLPEMGETNPFLHIAMHIALQEQISSNRPFGVTNLHQRLVKKRGSTHDAEHAMLECLAEMIWKAQRDHVAPDEAVYMEGLKSLI